MEPRDEGATFAPKPIARRRTGGWLVIALWSVAIGGLVALAGYGRLTGSTAPVVVPRMADASATIAPAAVASSAVPERAREPAIPSPFVFDVRRDGAQVVVHGTVRTATVDSIALALRDERGRATEWTTIVVADRSRATGPEIERRFDASILIPHDLTELPTWVEASAYTADGRRLGPPRNAIVAPVAADAAAFADLRVGARTTGPESATGLVQVHGRLLARAVRLTIRLETGGEVLDEVARDVSDPDGGIRPILAPAFTAEFDLTAFRGKGPLWVGIAAYDGNGGIVAQVRRPVSPPAA